MKQTKLYILTIGLLLGAMLLAACQSDALPGEDNSIEEVSRTDSCYINLRIVNTSQAKTRATETATSAENAIYDGILCIFQGESEATATLKGAVVIDQLINNGTTNGVSVNITQRLAGTHPYGTHLYVLALLNTSATGFAVSGTALTLNGTTFPSTTTIGDIRNSQVNSVGSTEKHVGLFMSNAPQTSYIMPEATALFDTEAKARASGAARVTINVERAAAKVKVTNEATKLDNINLNSSSSHPSVHKMTWTPNNFYTKSLAVRGGTGSISSVNFTASDFSVYPQRSHSGDHVYLAEGSTDIIVEVQLKDASSMLMHECFQFNGGNTLYTSTDALIAFYKNGWETNKSNYPGISGRTADEVFKYPTVTVGSNGTVSVTLTNESFSSAEKTALNSLATTLSGYTKGFRDGKMYYTYTLSNVVRNNAYNLTLRSTSISGIGRPTPYEQNGNQ